ncbi:MAG: hypothetical protein ACI4AM_04870 [Muribaculaceae bacterium]
MKKFFLCLMAVLMTIPVVSAQFSTYAEFKAAMSSANEMCPIDLSPLGYITSIELTDSPRQLTYTVIINSTMVSYEVLNGQRQMMKNNVKQMLCTDQMKILINPCVQHRVSFCFRYKWPDGKLIDITFTPSELNTIYNTEVDDTQVSRNMVEQMIAGESAQCPINLGSGMTEQSVYRFEDNIYYEIQLDESIYDIASLNTNQSMMRQYMEELLTTPGMKAMLAHVVNCGYNIVFLYVGSNSGRTYEMKFTNTELKRMQQ